MAFKKFQKKKYPPRFWALVGYPGAGKSTFATQMKAPLLAIDADNRFGEVVNLIQGDSYQFSDRPEDNADPARITQLLNENMAGAGIETIVIDSLTAIITPLIVQAMTDNQAGVNKNRIAAFQKKALAMRQLQDTITKWGCDTLWIYHLQNAMDAKAEAITRTTLPQTERERLYRSLNLELHLIQEDNKRGVTIAWARRGRSGITLWDESGTWAGMPERIEAAVYDEPHWSEIPKNRTGIEKLLSDKGIPIEFLFAACEVNDWAGMVGYAKTGKDAFAQAQVLWLEKQNGDHREGPEPELVGAGAASGEDE